MSSSDLKEVIVMALTVISTLGVAWLRTRSHAHPHVPAQAATPPDDETSAGPS
jgi:hypothetical protein